MNKILKLFDKQYVKELLTEKVLPLYPDFTAVKSVSIHAYKDHVWDMTYHVVIEFSTTFLTKDGKKKKLPIFCSAHSEEPRKNVYDALRFLWDHGFGQGYLSIPHPLFYSEYFRGVFYRGVRGYNLYHYIREKNTAAIEEIIPKAAAWFSKLHRLPINKARNFNEENSRIDTVFPGVSHILWRIKENYPSYADAYKRIYRILISREKKFLASTPKRWLVHGDAHPENIIEMSKKKTAVIDFTDLCLADFARDIGSFLQQLEFMLRRKNFDQKYAESAKRLFLKNYFLCAKLEPDAGLNERIQTYYYWTAIRTATYFLLKDNHEPQRSFPLIDRVCEGLEIDIPHKSN